MSGYREHSFNPNAYEQPGPPLRPFNWVQWTGVVFEVIGVAALLAYAAGRIGWTPEWIEHPGAMIMLGAVGAMLINSRRQPGTQVGSEQLERNRKVLLITVAILAAIFGAVLVIEFGAKG